MVDRLGRALSGGAVVEFLNAGLLAQTDGKHILHHGSGKRLPFHSRSRQHGGGQIAHLFSIFTGNGSYEIGHGFTAGLRAGKPGSHFSRGPQCAVSADKAEVVPQTGEGLIIPY